MKGAADTPELEVGSPAWLQQEIESILDKQEPTADDIKNYFELATEYNKQAEHPAYDTTFFNNKKPKSEKMATAKKAAPKKAAAKKPTKTGAAKKAAPKKAAAPKRVAKAKADKPAKEVKNTGAGLGRPKKGDGTVVQQIPFFTTFNDAQAFTKYMGFEGVRGGLSKAIKKLHVDHFGKEFGQK